MVESDEDLKTIKKQGFMIRIGNEEYKTSYSESKNGVEKFTYSGRLTFVRHKVYYHLRATN